MTIQQEYSLHTSCMFNQDISQCCTHLDWLLIFLFHFMEGPTWWYKWCFQITMSPILFNIYRVLTVLFSKYGRSRHTAHLPLVSITTFFNEIINYTSAVSCVHWRLPLATTKWWITYHGYFCMWKHFRFCWNRFTHLGNFLPKDL